MSTNADTLTIRVKMTYLPVDKRLGTIDPDGWADVAYPLREGETREITLDLADWLGQRTISSATITSKGATVVSSSNTTSAVTIEVSSTGRVEAKLTLDNGDVRTVRCVFIDPTPGGSPYSTTVDYT